MTHKVTAIILLAAGLAVAGCVKKGAAECVQDPQVRAQMKLFAAGKENQALALASAGGKELPSDVGAFFSAAENGDWPDTTNDYANLRRRVNTNNAL